MRMSCVASVGIAELKWISHECKFYCGSIKFYQAEGKAKAKAAEGLLLYM